MQYVGNFSALVSLLALVITWLIIQPQKADIMNLGKTLERSLDTLNRSIEKLYSVCEGNKQEINELRERVAKLEASIASAHKRIDEHSK